MKRHPSRLIKTPLDELTYQIIGCAMAVHGRRGPGFREEVYQADMEEHLKAKGFVVAAEQPVEVYDTNRGDVLLGFYIPDVTKRQEYARAGIAEYWIADPQAKIVSVLKLSGKSYEVCGEYGRGAVAESSLLEGFKINMDEIWRRSE